MKQASFLLALSLFLFYAIASSESISIQRRIKRDSGDSIPPGWNAHHIPLHPEHSITLQIALKQSRFNLLAKALDEVSDPSHKRYGQYLSKEQVEDLVQPHPSSLRAVEDWLESAGIDLSNASRSPAKDWIFVTVPVALAEAIVETKYSIFGHPRSQRKVVRSTGYSLPASVADHIDFIQPAGVLGLTSSRRLRTNKKSHPVDRTASLLSTRSQNATSPCGNIGPTSLMTPACLAHLYRFENYKPRSIRQNKLGVVNYLGDFLVNADLQQFYQEYKPEAVNTTFSIQSVGGGITDSDSTGSEAALDIEYAAALTFPTPIVAYSVGDHAEADGAAGQNEQFLGWALFVLNQTNPPQVFTTSYADTESGVSRVYATRVCNTFAQLGARGISVIFGSGDAGVDNNVPCQSVTNTTKFEPSFPGGCPYLTSIGGTEDINPEVGVGGPGSSANYRGSGGGFSNYFPRPSWQDKAVSAYLKSLGSTYSGLFNSTGRAFPDIAAQSSNFATVEDGEIAANSGTSASGPVVAAVVSLLNDYRISRGQPPLGFLNPWLYSKGCLGLNDILQGESEGCNGRGFNASKGWDPVTGLGTPDFIKLQQLV